MVVGVKVIQNLDLYTKVVANVDVYPDEQAVGFRGYLNVKFT